MKQFIVLVAAILSVVNSKPMITKDKWVKDLIYLAKSRSEYSNKYPYNQLYFDGLKWYTDCINIHKALFNGRDIYNPRRQNILPDPINTDNISAEGLINTCTNVSKDFKKLKNGEPRILFLNGHIGAYLGKEITISKGVVNVVEATPAWEHKILFSYVDSNGNRRYFKESNNIRGKWERHGKPSKWVQY